jgi:transposase
MSGTRCYEWFKRYKDGRKSTYDEPRLGRPSTSCNDAHVMQVREIMRSNRRLTVREIAEDCNISIGSYHHILMTKLEMHRVVSKFLPQFLTQGQRDCHLPGTFGSR